MSEMIIYQDDSGTTNLEVKLENETLWLSQKQLSELFDVTTATINEHIKNITNVDFIIPTIPPK